MAMPDVPDEVEDGPAPQGPPHVVVTAGVAVGSGKADA